MFEYPYLCVVKWLELWELRQQWFRSRFQFHLLILSSKFFVQEIDDCIVLVLLCEFFVGVIVNFKLITVLIIFVLKIKWCVNFYQAVFRQLIDKQICSKKKNTWKIELNNLNLCFSSHNRSFHPDTIWRRCLKRYLFTFLVIKNGWYFWRSNEKWRRRGVNEEDYGLFKGKKLKTFLLPYRIFEAAASILFIIYVSFS